MLLTASAAFSSPQFSSFPAKFSRTLLNFSKKLNKYRIFDKCNLDFETITACSEEECFYFLKFAESERYIFYNCCIPTNCIIRRTKRHINSMVYFGEAYGSIACVFHNHLFISPSELNSLDTHVHVRNIETGQTTDYQWLSSEKTYFLIDNMGHQFSADCITKMEVKDKLLYIDVQRRYGYDHPQTLNKDYQIIVRYDQASKQFIANYFECN